MRLFTQMSCWTDGMPLQTRLCGQSACKFSQSWWFLAQANHTTASPCDSMSVDRVCEAFLLCVARFCGVRQLVLQHTSTCCMHVQLVCDVCCCHSRLHSYVMHQWGTNRLLLRHWVVTQWVVTEGAVCANTNTQRTAWHGLSCGTYKHGGHVLYIVC